ncbi:flagellar basal body protein [bacterium]|nr:flagellar basal body protein [bacterium]
MNSLPTTLDLMKQALDVRIAEHKVHAANIANLDTPGYKAKETSFEAKLAHTMEGDDKWKVEMRVEDSNRPGRADGNNVSMEQEMSDMTQNSLQYMSTLNILNKHMALVKYAINGN